MFALAAHGSAQASHVQHAQGGRGHLLLTVKRQSPEQGGGPGGRHGKGDQDEVDILCEFWILERVSLENLCGDNFKGKSNREGIGSQLEKSWHFSEGRKKSAACECPGPGGRVEEMLRGPVRVETEEQVEDAWPSTLHTQEVAREAASETAGSGAEALTSTRVPGAMCGCEQAWLWSTCC